MRLMGSASRERIFTTVRNLFHTFMFYTLKSAYLYRSRGFFLIIIFFLYSWISLVNVYFIILCCYFHIPSANFSTKRIKVLSGEITQPIWPKMGTSLAIEGKTGQRRVVSACEILFLFFGIGIVRSDVTNDIFPFLTTCALIIKQVLPKNSDSYMSNWHSKFANCLTWPKADVLPYHCFKFLW